MSSPRLWSFWEIMQTLNGGRLVHGLTVMVNTRNLYQDFCNEGLGASCPVSNYHEMRDAFCGSRDELSKAGCAVAAASVQNLIDSWSKAKFADHPNFGGEQAALWERLDTGRIASQADEARLLIYRELESKLLLSINTAHAAKFAPLEPPFGQAVDQRFPAASDDIEESGKCLALGRYTASVFHIMRAAEAAAAVVSTALGGAIEKDGEPLTFGGLFNEVSNKIDAMPRGPEKDAWLRLKGFMSALNRGTRTKVAHPGTFYTEEKAEALFGAAKSFMEEADELLQHRP